MYPLGRVRRHCVDCAATVRKRKIDDKARARRLAAARDEAHDLREWDEVLLMMVGPA